jgi:hypothetical protein
VHPILSAVCAILATLIAAAPALAEESDPPSSAGIDVTDHVRRDLTMPLSLAETPQPPSPRLRSYELPPVTVTGQKPSELREEDRVGPYQQPRWTTVRRFPNTRVYVVPEGKVETELWFIPRFYRDGSTDSRSLAEVEIGLPYRFQLDLYYRLETYTSGSTDNGAQIELRWALADWGKIPLNPTLYAEYITFEGNGRPDIAEFKLLLGDELAPRWHWGINLVTELETGGEREYVYELDGGISYSLFDEKFAVGVETKIEWATTRDNRSEYDATIMVGPSFQWKPLPQLTINLAPLFGVERDDPMARVYLNVGWEF